LPHPSSSGEQELYRRIHDQQVSLAKQQLRILEIETYLSLARKNEAQQPDDAGTRTVIRHLEKMHQLAESLRGQAEASLNRLWGDLR